MRRPYFSLIFTFLVIIPNVVFAQKKSLFEMPTLGGPAVSKDVTHLLDQANKAQGSDLLTAKASYQKIINEHNDYDKIADVQQKLGDINVAIIFSKIATPQTTVYEVIVGDSLGKIAKKYGTTTALIKRSNNLKSDVIRVGQKLRIWTAPFTAEIDKSQNILVLKTGDEILKTYRVATGRNNITPVGVFTIDNKIEKPVWFKSGAQPIPSESPENELGSRWMGFGEDPHYGLHGTIHPEAIGQQATAGCVRLNNKDVEELFDIIPRGTKVTIQD